MYPLPAQTDIEAPRKGVILLEMARESRVIKDRERTNIQRFDLSIRRGVRSLSLMDFEVSPQKREVGTYTYHDTRSGDNAEAFETIHGSFETALGVDSVVENFLSFLRGGVRQHSGEKLDDIGRGEWLVDAYVR
jgi:hypothetical protein